MTSGGNSEVLYPQSGKYWTFDVNAQNGPAMPATIARNPFPGWRPGTAGLTTTQVTQSPGCRPGRAGRSGTSGRAGRSHRRK